MQNENQEYQYRSNVPGILAGMLVGSLAGAVTMLLLAPQSGKRTRMQIQEKGIELRDMTSEMVENTVAQARLSAHKLTNDGRRKMKKLQHQGQELATEQFERVAAAFDAGKATVQSS
ncbi:MAG: hypothetical protein CO094_12925 [Anaerolineae bacterium CG_4_9_14_3_um_filter_57_17]|nr:YtxH domain-containing protein [bacterium]NCT21234.1 YtxH domain-containing protein [bacterium]OIO86452.1 MAG: hypothetical protein AUK01_02945 [Anaerolineae bacterium CG2_30_57_67]PJB64433.1 MAG: hypothetical protein CO094_12925 [Anaerolineae bacterium CG_4_9_14_3_um_filter_57_17]